MVIVDIAWYGEVGHGLPVLENGQFSVSEAPGHGVVLGDDVLTRPDCQRRTTSEADL